MKRLVIAALVGIGAPAMAQTASPASISAVSPVNPARLAGAKPVIDQVWPLGASRRFMHASMDQAIQSMMGGMSDMKASDLVRSADLAAATAQARAAPAGAATTIEIAPRQAAMPPSANGVAPAAVAQGSTAHSDPARLAAAERLLGLVHLEQQYDALFARLIPVMSVQVFTSIKDNVRVPAKIRTELADAASRAEAERIFAEETMKGFKARYPELRAVTAREYAAVFTADELDQLAAFYASPVGQKSLAAMPALQGKLMPIGMAAGRQVGAAAMQRTFDRLELPPRRPAT